MRSWILWLLIAAVVVGVAVTLSVTGLPTGAPRKYLSAKVTMGRVETVVNSTGTVKPVKLISVGAFTSGPIQKIYVDFRDEVTKGKDLALIDPKLQTSIVASDKANVAAQEAELLRVKALLKKAENEEERARKLRKSGKDYISDTDMDEKHFTRLAAEAQVKLAEANIVQAQAKLENSEAQLAYTHIVAPDDGVVIERKVDEGQTVAATFQTPELFTIATEMDKVNIYASVDEADIGMINGAKQRGNQVKFIVDAYPGELFDGHIFSVRMNATTVQNVVTYPVVIEAPNPGRKLFPGMTATITFPIDEKDDVLRLPVAALRVQPTPAQVRPEDRVYLETAALGGSRSATAKAERAQKRTQRHVWIQQGNLLRAVPVTLGLIDRQYAEIIEGDLVEGQEVAIGTELLTTQ